MAEEQTKPTSQTKPANQTKPTTNRNLSTSGRATVDLATVKAILQKLVALMGDETPGQPAEQPEAKPATQAKPTTKEELSNEELGKDIGSDFSAEVEVAKFNDEERISYGIAYPAQPIGWRDSQNDWIAPEEIRKMAHNFMINSQRYDMHHRVLDVKKEDAVIVESYLAPTDLDWPLPNGATKHINAGSWIVATHYPSVDVWNRVKKGEFGAYSIRGKAKRSPIAKNTTDDSTKPIDN